MKNIKRIELLQAKERLNRKKSATRLGEINADEKKCSDIYYELGNLLSDTTSQKDSLPSNLYISERVIIHKMMDQREVMNNRLDYLNSEKKMIIEELNRSNFKDKVLGERKEKLRKDQFEKKQDIVDNELSSMKRH